MRKTRNIALLALLSMSLSLGVYGYMLYLTTSMGVTLSEKVTLIANANEKVNLYKGLREVFERTKEERAELERFALTEDEAAEFLTEVELVGSKEGVTIATQSIKIEKKKDTPDMLSVAFGIEGEEGDVRRMAFLFEQLPYKSIINSMTLGGTEGTYKASVEVQITLVKYDK